MFRILLLLALAPGPVRPQSPVVYPAATLPSRHAERIERARTCVQQLMQHYKLPGFAVTVAQDRHILWSEGFGYANVEQRTPVTAQTKFRVGSVSKVFCAAAVARLWELGRLDLDAPVQRYVPYFPRKQWVFTVRQLSGHLAGVRHYHADDPIYSGRHYATVRDGLRIFENDPLLHEPGTRYLYSSYGFNLLSAVVEGAAGQDYLTFLREHVLEPLGLRHTTPDENAAIVENRASFYERGQDGLLRNARYVDNSYKWGGGGMLSTTEDMCRFGAAHLHPGFLKKETLAALFTSQRLKEGKETGVGIAWRIGTVPGGQRFYSHGGTIDGGRTMLVMYPGSKVIVAMASNLRAGFGEKEAHEIALLFAE